MKGHFLSGTRKLNRHYQSGNDTIKPWLVTRKDQVTKDGGYWYGMFVNKTAYLNEIVFGCFPYYNIVSSIAVPFKFTFQTPDNIVHYVYTKNILESFPLSGELPLYREYPVGTVTQIGTVTLSKEENGNRWRITTPVKLKITQFSFQMTLNVTSDTVITGYIGYKKEVVENA